jgi:hypothetical protein
MTKLAHNSLSITYSVGTVGHRLESLFDISFFIKKVSVLLDIYSYSNMFLFYKFILRKHRVHLPDT